MWWQPRGASAGSGASSFARSACFSQRWPSRSCSSTSTSPKDRIDDLGLAILLLSYALIFVFCFANRSMQGLWIVAIGVALNVVVIALNQGMPASDDVVQRGGREVHIPIERTVKHKPESNDDLLPFLGDVFSLPGDNAVFSIGDIVIGLGIIDICFEMSRRPRRRGAWLDTSFPISSS